MDISKKHEDHLSGENANHILNHDTKTALLVMDVQREMFEKSTPVFRADQLLSSINGLINQARLAQAAIVFIQHNAKNYLIKGSEGWQLHPSLNQGSEDLKIFKEHGNAFEGTELHAFLTKEGIGRVVACGLVTHGCVKSTCLGAQELGYQVVLAGDAHSSYSADAEKMIEKWNQQLAQAGVEIIDSAQITF